MTLVSAVQALRRLMTSPLCRGGLLRCSNWVWLHQILNVPINQGAAVATAQYKAARALVFLSPVDAAISATLQDKGWQVLDFSDSELWPARFAEHPAVFGKSL